MNVTTLYYDYKNKSGEQSNQINAFIAAGLLHNIGHYFSQLSSYFVLTLCCRNGRICNFYNDIFNKIYAELKEWPLQIVIVKKNKYLNVPGLRQLNIIFTDSYDALLEAEIHTYTANYNNNEYYYIFLQTRDHLLPNEMQKIFEYCWLHYLINCIVQIQNTKGQMLFYTYYPFTAKHCGKAEAVLFNEFNGTALLHQELFPNKLNNFHGCPLKAALWHVPPFIHLSTDSKKRTHISGGIEGKLLLELASKLNFTLIIKIPENNMQRGVVLSNGSMTGALQMLQTRQADFSIGSFRVSSDRSRVATSTFSHHVSYVAVVALSDAFLLTSSEILSFPYATQLWHLVFAINISALVFIAILRRIHRKTKTSKNISHITLDVLLMLLGMPAIYKPKQTINRILNATWMVYALLIRTVYQALLFHLITGHITRGFPHTLDELLKDNYSMVTNLQTVADIKNVSVLKSIDIINLNSLADNITLKYLENIPMKQAKHFVAIIPTDFLHYYVQNTRKPRSFEVLPYRIMNIIYCIYLTKHSFLINQFNEILGPMQDVGFVDAWFHQALDIHYYNSLYLQADRAFGLHQLWMSFIVVLCGHCVATLVFVMELLYKKLQYRKFFWK